MVVLLIYDHSHYICLRVWIIVKVCCHWRIFSPPVHDIGVMIVHSAMEELPPISSTYCWPQLLHIIRYITLVDLHSPVVSLEKASVANSMGQVLHLATSHGWLPATSCDVDIKDAQSRRSFRFFGRQKAMRGGVGNVLHNCSKTWRINRCCLVVQCKDGKRVWYITTKGVQADFPGFA